MDLGYHFDIAELVLRELGFSDSAIWQAQVYNGCTDLFGNMPIEHAAVVDALSPIEQADEVIAKCKRFHFDNIWNGALAKKTWNILLNNIKHTLAAMDEHTPPTLVLAALGIALHACQDFHSHSNWNDLVRPTEDGKKFSPETWFKNTLSETELAKVKSGHYEFDAAVFPNWTPPDMESLLANHPGHEHLNLDYQERVYGDHSQIAHKATFREAYVSGFVASLQLATAACQNWISDPLLSKAKQFAPRGDQYQRLVASRQDMIDAFKWIFTEDHNGHWKGQGSSDPSAARARFFLAGIKTIANDYINPDLTTLTESLSKNLYQKDQETPDFDYGVFQDISPRFVVTFHVELARVDITNLRSSDTAIDYYGDADLYCQIDFHEQKLDETIIPFKTYIERTIRGNSSPGLTRSRYGIKNVPPWTVIHVVPKVPNLEKLELELCLRDEDLFDPTGDDVLDISPKLLEDDLDLALDLQNAQISGDGIAPSDGTVTSSGEYFFGQRVPRFGENYNATVQFSLAVATVADG